jgi:hypothetical protein
LTPPVFYEEEVAMHLKDLQFLPKIKHEPGTSPTSPHHVEIGGTGAGERVAEGGMPPLVTYMSVEEARAKGLLEDEGTGPRLCYVTHDEDEPETQTQPFELVEGGGAESLEADTSNTPCGRPAATNVEPRRNLIPIKKPGGPSNDSPSTVQVGPFN